jgi:pilus assembly protein FimV
MKTAVRRVLLMSALMTPSALYALGLGEIRLNSALNQPFDAEIELVSATQEDLGALRATLAPVDAFARYGLDRPAFLSEFSFQVTRDASGRDVLRVTSTRPVTEPFVTLLVEANWPRGRLLREYTVLLDPPVFAPGPAASQAVSAPLVSSGGATSARTAPASSAPAPSQTFAPATSRSAPADVPAASPSLEPGDTYQVRPNDTLYRIASRVNPGSRADINRAMVSIYQNNPHAFDGNINVLRSGSTLRLPDASQIQAISAAEASAEVARQYEAWRSGGAGAGAGDAAGRLRLVTPEQGTAAPSTATAAAPATPSAATGAGTVATADAGLQDRVRQLEAELAEARRLLEVRNAELATLQGTTAPTPAAEPEAPAEGAEPAEGADATAAPVETPAETPATPAAEEPAKPAKKPAKRVAPPEAKGPTLLERLLDYWWVLAALVAAGLGFAIFQRVRRERGSAESDLEEALGAPDLRTSPRYAPRSHEGDILVEEKRAVEPVRAPAAVAAPAAASVESPRAAPSFEETLSGDTQASTEPGDPLAEADFHMAYGLYDQAADLVQLAIRREPQRRDLKLKLLEIFFVWGNKDRFLELARELNATRAQAPAGEWDKVLIMGKQLAPGEPMFAATPSASVDSLDMELHAATGTLDLDISGMPETATDVDIGASEETAVIDATGLDFVLDETAVAQRPSDSQVSPTIEMPRVGSSNLNDTQELTVDNLGLDVDALRDLNALDGDTVESPRGQSVEDTVETPRGQVVEDTVETPIATRNAAPADVTEETDLLSSTSILDATSLIESTGIVDLSDATGRMPSLEATGEVPSIEATGESPSIDATGQLPAVDQDDSTAATRIANRLDFDLGGEPPTMSEVGTKLDLARAYMDMGDPEGARSILDEVLQEGNTVQKQEAERLIASLP